MSVAGVDFAQNSVAPVVPDAYHADAISCEIPEESTYVIEPHCENVGVVPPDPSFMFVSATPIRPHDMSIYTEFATVIVGTAVTTYSCITFIVDPVSYAT